MHTSSRISKMRWRWTGGLATAALAFASPASFAGTYYVSPGGTAAWPACADRSTPCSPPTAMENVVAGDVVYFRGGDYYPPDLADPSFPSWYPHASGTPELPILLIAHPGEVPTIHQPTGLTSASGIGAAQHDHAIWDGFRLIKRSRLGASSLYRCYMGNNNTIRNSEFIGNEGLDPLNQVGLMVNHCTETYVYNNVFRSFTGVGGVNAGAMWLFENDHAYVFDNAFYDSSNGVQTKSAFSFIFAHHNFFSGVVVPFHWQHQDPTVSDFHVYDNVAVLPSGGTFLYAFDPSSPYRNNSVHDNTVFCSSSCRGMFLGNENTLDFNAWNNIIHGAAGPTTFVQVPSGAGAPEYLDHNAYYAGAGADADWRLDYSAVHTSIEPWRAATGFDLASVTSDPLFVNPGGTHPADYERLAYPHDGRGGSYSPVMGAYVTGNERIGHLPPPRNFR